jgi:hypothetical protein
MPLIFISFFFNYSGDQLCNQKQKFDFFFPFLLMPRNFFVVKEKIRKMAHYSFQKNSGEKLQLFTKRKIMLGDDFEFVQKIERNP